MAKSKRGRGGCIALEDVAKIQVIPYRSTFIGFRFDNKVFDRHNDAHLFEKDRSLNEVMLQEQGAEARKLLEEMLRCNGVVVSLIFNHHEIKLQLVQGALTTLVIRTAGEILQRYCPKAAIVT